MKKTYKIGKKKACVFWKVVNEKEPNRDHL